VALLLASVAAPLAAQSRSSSASSSLGMLSMLKPSVAGSYLAGQHALSDLSTEPAARYFSDAANDDWDNPVVVERAFVALAADGQIGQAASTAKHLLSLDAKNQLGELVVATEALKERRYRAADRLLANIGQDSFTGITANGLEDFLVFHRALMAESAGNTKLAVELVTKAYDNEPLVARIVEVYARILANSGNFEDAEAAVAQFEGRGLTHPIITRVKEALEAHQRPGIFASNVQVGAAEMFHGIGVALARDGSLDLALVFLRLGLYLDPSADVISLATGQLLDAAGQRDAANRIYDGVPPTSIMKSTAVVRVAQNLDAAGDRPEAIRRLSNIVLVNPEDLDAVSVLGDMYRYDEQYQPAIEAYTKAIELTGGESATDWRFYYVRGIAYERAKEWPKAEADFQKALKLNPDQPQVLNYLGYSWIDQDMHLEPALMMIEKAVEAMPQDGYIVDSLGWAFYKLGRIDEAVEQMEKAVQLRPNDPEINDHLGDVYWKAGRKLEARFQWTIAASVDTEGNVKERVAPKLADGLTDANATK
jgi:tetratricopeptide (TPR) repeat protein